MEIFFLFFEKANYPAVQPVMRLLHARGSLQPVFVKGFDYKEYSGQVAPFTPAEPFETLDIFDFLGSGFAANSAARDTLPLLAPRGGFELHAARHLFELEIARPRFQVALREFSKVAAALEAFAAARRPQIVVLPEDTDYIRGRLAAQVLKAGTSIVVLSPNFYNMFSSYPLVGRRYADHYLVMNSVLRGRLRRLGVPERAIAIVGNPAFDELRSVRLGRHDPKVFLFAAQGFDSDRQIVADLVSVFRRLPAYRLLVKPHPEAGEKTFDGLMRDLPNAQLLQAPLAAGELLERASCVIAQTSTLLHQAIVVGRPVIVTHYRPGPIEIALPPEVAGGAIASNLAGLEQLVRLAGEGRLPQASPVSVQPPGFRASQRAADKLDEICAAI